MACLCDDGRTVVVTDSAVGCEDGFRRLMSQGKWWYMGCLLIGEAGDDFALSRIRHKTVKRKKWEELRDPYTFSELVCQVQTEVKGEEGPEALEAELLHVAEELYVIGGDGGITGPFPYTAVGQGATIALPLMDALIGDSRYMKKRTVVKITNKMLEIITIVATYTDSVCAPFHHKIFNPNADFKEL